MRQPFVFPIALLFGLSLLALAACGGCSDNPDCRATEAARRATEDFTTVEAATWAAATLDVPAPLTLEFKTRTPTPTSTRAPTKTPTPTPKPTGSQVREAAPPAISMDLDAGRSNPVGSGVFIAQADQTQVRVDLKPNGSNATQLASIQQGTCQQFGAVKYPLTNVVNGSSRTVIDASLASLLTGNLVVHIAPSADQPDKSYACGEIPKGAVTMLGPGRDGDQSPAYAVLLAAGNQTLVTLNVSLTESSAEQPAALFTGSCANLGSAKYKLANVRFGASRTTLNMGLADLLKGGLAINVSKSTAEPTVYIACGDLK